MAEDKQYPSIMAECNLSLGIDVGSATLAAVLLNNQNDEVGAWYTFHNGNIHQCLQEMLNSIPIDRIGSLGVNEPGRTFLRTGDAIDDQVAVIEGVRAQIPSVRAILHIGAECFGLILFDEKGKYSRFLSNTGCAAGTGSFLDQQARRLGLADSTALCRLALNFRGAPPLIATRCAVFAKTDLIHAQQKGHTLNAICAGLCEGVGSTILDTVKMDIGIPQPFVISGGVALNRKVTAILRKRTHTRAVRLDHPERIVAWGAARLSNQTEKGAFEGKVIDDLIREKPVHRTYHHGPLTNVPIEIEQVPLIDAFMHHDVETELYTDLRGEKSVPVYFGTDIGSTSTKALLMTPSQAPVLGLYTRTQGQPVRAVQRLMGTVRHVESLYGMEFQILASGTTGSGRKFIRKILEADEAMDEINAHARAAFHLNPRVDTIIEIGGQDSKFTVLREGRVVFSVMNTVCAAGTGSFLEEQARRLGVALADYADRVESASAPMTSDRCTVFMERDLNYLLALGYTREELLAAALHSVRDNYLTKVAHPQKIGNVITFQGATAKNRALVKVFRQRLAKPIWVSSLCHLTGAMGVCLTLQDRNIRLNHRFRHQLDKTEITVDETVCQDCSNHCKILSIHVGSEEITWGHLCGKNSDGSSQKIRPYWIRPRAELFSKFEQEKQIPPEKRDTQIVNIKNTVAERARRSLYQIRHSLDFRIPRQAFFEVREKNIHENRSFRIGLPNTLYFMDTLPLWHRFFQDLGTNVIVSRTNLDTLPRGKRITGAEFCAPIGLFHGHVQSLLSKCDWVFLPVIFQHRLFGDPKSYCYYSNYAVSLIQNNPNLKCSDRIISPVMTVAQSIERQASCLWNSFPDRLRNQYTYDDVMQTFRNATYWFQERQETLRRATKKAISEIEDIGVLLLGRPYLVLDERMNCRIPHRLTEMGLQVFYQDMLTLKEGEIEIGRDLVSWNHWFYGDMIMNAAERIAESTHLFPIYLTAFKCSPDAFVLSYFSRMMEKYGKPFLILQLDEHQNIEGYDTRLEAAVETFRNYTYHRSVRKPVRVEVQKKIGKKMYLLPNYDPESTRMMAAAFRHHGIQALPIVETEETVKSSIRLNDGQCLPVSAIAQAIIHTVDVHDLNPQETAVFANALCRLSCNFPQYPIFLKQLLEQHGHGMEKIDVFASRSDMTDLPTQTLGDVYCAFLLGGLIRKMVCKIRPREVISGETDAVCEQSLNDLTMTIEHGRSKERVFLSVVDRFLNIEQDIRRAQLPLVAIIGDLYVRDNHVFNQNLIRIIENAEAEAVTTPHNFLVRMTADPHFNELMEERKYLTLFLEKALLTVLKRFDEKFYQIAMPVLKQPLPRFRYNFKHLFSRYHLTTKHSGETTENVLKIFHLLEHNPQIRLFVHVNPVFCCPALVSESLFKRIEEDINRPIVSITYDGTQTPHNRILKPYLHFLKKASVS